MLISGKDPDHNEPKRNGFLYRFCTADPAFEPFLLFRLFGESITYMLSTLLHSSIRTSSTIDFTLVSITYKLPFLICTVLYRRILTEWNFCLIFLPVFMHLFVYSRHSAKCPRRKRSRGGVVIALNGFVVFSAADRFAHRLGPLTGNRLKQTLVKWNIPRPRLSRQYRGLRFRRKSSRTGSPSRRLSRHFWTMSKGDSYGKVLLGRARHCCETQLISWAHRKRT